MPSPAIKKQLVKPSADILDEGGKIYERQVGESERLLTDSANTKIYATHQKSSRVFLSSPPSLRAPILTGVY